MSFQRTLYTLSSSGSSTGGEIDLREKFDDFIFGTGGGVAHGHLIVLRKLRRSGGRPVDCVCKDNNTKEADPVCSYCLGEGFLWDEEWAYCYSVYQSSDGGLVRKNINLTPGGVRVDYRTFYLRYDCDLRYGDKIVEIKLDEEGRVLVPYVRKAIYDIETLQEFRSDNGRIEYVAVHSREEDAIRNDYE